MAVSGESPLRWDALAPLFAALVADLAGQGFTGPFAVADGRPVHAAGGSEAQELAVALAHAVAYLRALEAAGIALDDGRRMLFFRLAADADQLLTMAKFRALRKLWARVEEASGLAPRPAFVSAETAWRMLTRRDPQVNTLRTTMAAFAAGLGGADAVTVLPFTTALGLPDRFARRLARNTQAILLEESNLAKVADPAAGSGAIETLTDQLAQAAWSLFQEIERAGGAAAALEQGLIQHKIAAVRAEREKAIARRKETLTGTTEFPHLAEVPPAVLDVAAVTMVASGPAAIRFDALAPTRLAEPFEALRDASDRLLEASGSRPKVFLANLGRPADFTARASFARNFFEAGGIEAVANDGFASSPLPPGEGNTDLAALAAAFRASGAALACLCSSDALYAQEATDAAKALAEAGARHIYLAGRPGELETALKSAGVQTFIYAGGDALATLQAAHDILHQG
jgi:methylmalonyl-CoA mutase